jgi:4-hydroxy-3-methylbut-2-enyl diphosphate reductase
VHNKYVVKELQNKGVCFINELSEIPAEHRNKPVIISAHGVSPSVYNQANTLGIHLIDATCPLVRKVHIQAKKYAKKGYTILLIGHAGHEEIEGTSGEITSVLHEMLNSEDATLGTPAPTHATPCARTPRNTPNVHTTPPRAPARPEFHIIENAQQAENVDVINTAQMVYLSQTTLSLDETEQIVSTLKARFPNLKDPAVSDICYATQNRQMAVRSIASKCDLMIIVGSQNSSNSARLVEVSKIYGAKNAILLDNVDELNERLLNNSKTIGITSGASVPEVLVNHLVDILETKGYIIENYANENAISESITFPLPTL